MDFCMCMMCRQSKVANVNWSSSTICGISKHSRSKFMVNIHNSFSPMQTKKREILSDNNQANSSPSNSSPAGSSCGGGSGGSAGPSYASAVKAAASDDD